MAEERLGRILGHLSLAPAAGEEKAKNMAKELQHAVTTRQLPLRKPEFQKLLSPCDLKVSEIKTLRCDHIKDYIPDLQYRANHPERAKIMNVPRCYNRFTEDDEFVMLDLIRKDGSGTTGAGLVRAGARSAVPWRRGEVNAAIVTCGGLCPGLNVVINQIVETLYYNYGVNNIYGIKWGFRGIWNNEEPWLRLTPDSVLGIHELGGTILGSSRGGFNLPKMVDALLDKNVNQLYVIGGDGTHRGAHAIYLEGKRRKAKLAVACVPKTIDNDVGIIDHSFGFHTAVEKAVDAIRSSVVEASCIPNGIGVVKLMGREAGFIAAHAVLSSRRVDLCLVPEVSVELDGEDGVLNYLYRTTKKQGYAVVVVAEGAGVSMMKATQKRDESGNIRLPSIGQFLKQKINAYFKSKGEKANIKYHDPSYMIRSVPANAADSVMCNILAENAVHGAMAGYTGFTSGLVNNRSVYIPIPAITATSPVRLNPMGRTWERVCNDTQQPHKGLY